MMMSEERWLTCTDPGAMLTTLLTTRRGSGITTRKPSQRKCRLFVVACCRAIWEHMPDERSRRAVETAERFADGEASTEELVQCNADAVGVPENGPGRGDAILISAASCRRGELPAWNYSTDVHGDRPDDADRLRDTVGSPYHFPMTLARAIKFDRTRWGGRAFAPVVSWVTEEGLELARQAYDERPAGHALDPFNLGILADHLEEHGCDGQDFLASFKVDRPLYRGFWALDIVLGLE